MEDQGLVNFESDVAPLPAFDSSGSLPLGIHDCTLDDLAVATGFNDHRRKMWLQLASFLAWPILIKQFSYAYFGGGFVSNAAAPSDIDVILETAKPFGPDALLAVSRFFAFGIES